MSNYVILNHDLHGQVNDMLMDERLNELLSYMHRVRAARYTQIAKDLHISQSTARRDAAVLEEQGHVEKVYGGIMLSSSNINTMPMSVRIDSHAQAKAVIGRKAAKTVQDKMSIFLYGSSTVMHMVPYLANLNRLRVLTNSTEICEKLTEAGCEAYCTGGSLRMTDKVFVGPYADESLKSFRFDASFFSPSAISLDGDVTIYRSESQSFLRIMLQKSRKRYMLCDSSKLGQSEFFSVCNVEDLDDVFCEKDLPEILAKRIGANREKDSIL